MKTVYIILGILLISGGMYFIFSSPRGDITNYPPKPGPVVAFGDSLIEGVGAPKEKNFISVLSAKIGKPILNMGVSGNTTSDGLARIDAVLAQKPGVVLLLLGGNDYLRRIPKEETFSNLRTIIEMLQQEGAVVVLLGVRGGILVDGFYTSFEVLAEETGSIYVEDVLDGIFGRAELMSDSIHPNEKGYAIIAEKVYQSIMGIDF